MPESSEARKWHRMIRASVREACETWRIQARAGKVTDKTLEQIINRASAPLLDKLQAQPAEVVAVLMPSVVRTMLWAVLEVIAEEPRRGKRP